MSSNKNEDLLHERRIRNHTMMHCAYKVKVKNTTDPMGHSVTQYQDEFGDTGPIRYNLFRGYQEGEGHADRLLDNYLKLERRGTELKCSRCDEYREHLLHERTMGDKPPHFSVRERLYRQL